MILKKYNLFNKTALITGAGKGLGKVCAISLAEAGADIIILSRTKKDLDLIVNKTKKIKRRCTAFVCDVTNYNEVEKLFKKIKKLDILINNAGTNMDNLSLRMKEDEWKKVIDINLGSTFFLCKYAIKKMLKNKYGKIVNIASVVGHTGNLGQANYSASKAGIIGMTKSLALEYAKKNILINCVSPGFIQSKMTDNISEDVKSFLTSRIPMSKLGTGEDVSNTVAFLSSDASSYITGETIHVNGGMYMA